MRSLEQIKKAVLALDQGKFDAFSKWLEALKAERWDDQIEADARCGRLDRFAQEALAELQSRKTNRP
ncbi:hypothetical protein [Rhizobium sp. 21-4511-3d]